MQSLNDNTRFWFTAAMRCMDGRWSETTGLVDRYHSLRDEVRGTAWYALGLLMRDGADDRARAAQALERVLANQWTDPPGRRLGVMRDLRRNSASRAILRKTRL